jgi:hypothetical protein
VELIEVSGPVQGGAAAQELITGASSPVPGVLASGARRSVLAPDYVTRRAPWSARHTRSGTAGICTPPAPAP